MERIVELYNNAPHRELSRILHFPVSPKMAQLDDRIEREIVRYAMTYNHNMRDTNGFTLPVGTKCYVYNSKDAMAKRRSVLKPWVGEIVAFNGALYDVRRSDNGAIEKCARSMLRPLGGT
jgi:hypothetical protein